jgi:tRNA-specific 2-thiouridylase
VPLYVRSIDAGGRRIVVGTREEATRDGFELRDVNWVGGEPPDAGRSFTVRVRHRHEGVPARVRVGAETVTVTLAEPTLGVAPGQAAVFYDGEEVVGGGWIL